MNKELVNSLALNAHKLDATGVKTLSYGPKTGTRNLIDEAAKALQLSWRFSNKTATDQIVIFSPIITPAGASLAKNDTLFESQAELLTATGATVVFANGKVFSDGGADFDIASLTPNRKIAQFVRYFANNPLRFTAWRMNSQKTDGTPESTNYSNSIKSFWFTPFDTVVENEKSLRDLVMGGQNFNRDLLDVDFQAINFPAILSNEHFLIFQVNAGTDLTITASIGAQDSKSQRFYRTVKDADDLIRAERIKMMR